MPKKPGKHAWVVTWDWVGNHRKPDQLLLHFLKASWPSWRVSDYLQALYINSAEIAPISRLYYIKRGLRDETWDRKIRDRGTRVTVGDNPMLLAVLVNDLSVVRSGPGQMEVSWTHRPVVPVNWTPQDGPPGEGTPRKFLVDLETRSNVTGAITDISPHLAESGQAMPE